MAIRIAITDDHPVVTKGLVKMFADFPQMQVVATYPNGQSLLDGVRESLPDVLLLDMHLPDIGGPVLAAAVLKANPAIKIIVLSSSDVLLQVKKMLQIGCMGYLLKDSDDLTIIKAVETVFYGGQFLSPVLQQGIMDDLFKNKNAEKKQASLTRREKEILKLIVQESTNQEIAEKLFISPHTVDNHRISLLHKLGAKNTAGLVRIALETGLYAE
ncbi:MAG: response regulator transcription factor [Bacteroidota bacterium]